MAYDPRMMQQMGRMGIGMLGQPQGTPFERPKEWWEQAPPARPGGSGGAQSPQDDPANSPNGQLANRPKQPPSLLDMMMGLGRMTRPQYDKAIQGSGSSPKDAARLGPWAFLGSLGTGGKG
jgi:hypothetical protein